MPALKLGNGKITLSYIDQGEGDICLVFLHGFPFTAELWRPQVDALAHRYRIIAPNLRGFGNSLLPAEPYTLANLADDVAELIAALGLKKVVIVGLSMGGYVAFELFRRHQRLVRALVLADTKPDPDTETAREARARLAQLAESDGSAAVTRELLPKLLAERTRTTHPQIEQQLIQMMDAARPEAIAAASRAMAERVDSRPLLPRITLPVLVIGGSEDSLAPPEPTRAWARALPNAIVHFIKGAGHVSNLERPEEFNHLLSDFLGQVTSRSVRQP
ncbi:MAG: alpha/beta fold hydrolase [Gemmatimonadota bacterium]|nr:MAG: alpha/beta fold hydrolase [Gemmatimonadota bacterium]